jgi:uncharacterized protein YndB with AHSA1/START domain
VNDRRGTLEMVDGRPVLRFERHLGHSPEKVWRVVTEPSELAYWFPAKVETEVRTGATMRFFFEGSDEPSFGEVLEADRPRRFVFRWEDSEFRCEITPEGDGCRLLFTHVVGEVGGGLLSAGRTAAGWDACLAALESRLDGTEPPSDMAGFREIEAYLDEFGLADGQLVDGSVVRFERDLVWAPLDKIWATLVEEETPEPGSAPPVRATNGYVAAGAVTEAEPQRVLEYESDGGRVRWEFTADPATGTRVVLTHTDPSDPATALAAWHTHLELFYAALNGTDVCPWPADRTEHLTKMYAERLAG